MPSPSSGLNLALNNLVDAGPLFMVALLWGVHLGYPMHSLQHIRVDFLGSAVPLYYFFTVVPMLGAAALLLMFKRGWTRWNLLWWLLPLICLPGILQSDDRLWSFRQWLSWIVRGVIPGGIFFILYRDKADLMLTRWIYPIVIVASLLGFGEMYYDRNPLWENSLGEINLAIAQPDSNPFYRPRDSYIRAWSRRPSGTQGNRIVYAATLVGFLPLGLWLVRYGRRFRTVNLFAIVALASILLLAQARSVWVGAMTGVILMSTLGFLRNRRETVKIAAGAALCLGIFLAWPPTRELLGARFSSFHLGEVSIRERLAVLRTVEVLKDRWFFGVGFGQFPKVAKPYYPIGLVWNDTPDNQYFRWIIENGALSFVLLMAFFAGLVRAGWRKIQEMVDVRQADFYKSLLIGWLSIAVTFLFFDGFYSGACNMTFWCLLGLFATCLSSNNSREVVEFSKQ